MPNWLLYRYSCTILALRAVALPIVALRFWERTLAAPLLSRTIWGSAVQRQFGNSIALHTIASIAQHKSIDVACCQNGIACDYGGLGYNELSDDNKKAILSTFPRLSMKNELTTCLCGIAKNHPNTTTDNFIADFGLKYVPGYRRASSVDFLHQSPFAE